MPVHVFLAAVAVMAAVPLLWWSVAGARAPSHAAVTRNLTAGRAVITDLREAVLSRSASERAVRPAMKALARRARRLTPAGMLSKLERRIILAGKTAIWPLERVLAVKMLLGLVGLGVGALVFLANPSTSRLLLATGFAAVGFFLLDFWLYGRGRERQKTIQRELPDTLDQITISVEAGLGFESAMARAGRSGTGPLAEEVVRTLQEIQIGVPRSTALRNLSDRTDVPDLRHFVLAVLQAEAYGVPIARVLRVQAGELRVKRRQRAEERAMKIPVKVVFPLVLCILPTLFIIIIGPAAIRISRTLLGGGLGG